MKKSNTCLPNKYEMAFVGVIHRVLKSAIFNVAMIIIGFAFGFFTSLMNIHYQAIANEDHDYVMKIEQKVKDLKYMDLQYDRKEQEILDLLDEVKVVLAHDKIAYCRATKENKLKRQSLKNTNQLDRCSN